MKLSIRAELVSIDYSSYILVMACCILWRELWSYSKTQNLHLQEDRRPHTETL